MIQKYTELGIEIYMNYELSKTEEEIMQLLWENNRPMKTGEIMNHFTKNGKEWKRQTLNTLLIRLEEKGVIERKRGVVSARYTQKELEQIECRDFVKTRFGSKLSNFVLAFTGGERIDEDEADELIDLINKLKEER